MGFGFNLFALFILFPLIGIIVLLWVITGKRIFGEMLLYIAAGIVGLFLLSKVGGFFTAKTILSRDDYYGSYIVNRSYFRGRQADWQYDHFRFEIKDNDSIYFYVTRKEKVLQTFKGTITTTKAYRSEVLIIDMQQPTHHILNEDPTTYRDAWSFYLVFSSPKFGNVFFKKGRWKPISE